jgi:hypothetical protein
MSQELFHGNKAHRDTPRRRRPGLNSVLDDRNQRRALRDGADSRSEAGSTQVDIASMYNTECYCPQYKRKIGLPIFLTRP